MGSASDITLEGGAKADETPAKKSFLQQYWYVILPIAIMTFTGGGGQEQTAQGAEGAAQGQQQQGGGAKSKTA
jgi:hypothetical protein